MSTVTGGAAGPPPAAGAGRGGRGRRRLRRRLQGQPGIEIGAGQGVHVEQHDGVAGAAQFGALATERLARVLVIDLEVELVDPTRDHVALEQELRDVERVDDVVAGEVQLDGPTGRDDQAAIRAGRDELGEERIRRRRDIPVRVLDRRVGVRHVVELPLELSGDRPDLEVRLRGPGVDDVERLPGDHEEGRHDDRRDHGPDQLGDRVAVGLGGERVVARLAPIAQDRVDDQPFDDEEDDRGDEEDEGVQVPDVRPLLGDRDRWEQALDDPRAGAADEGQDQEEGHAEGDEHGREDRAVGRALRVLDIQGPQRSHTGRPVGASRRQEQGLDRPEDGPRP